MFFTSPVSGHIIVMDAYLTMWGHDVEETTDGVLVYLLLDLDQGAPQMQHGGARWTET